MKGAVASRGYSRARNQSQFSKALHMQRHLRHFGGGRCGGAGPLGSGPGSWLSWLPVSIDWTLKYSDINSKVAADCCGILERIRSYKHT